ncbi:MAG TPA: ABC transporter permease, partial [Terriglobales bacterium]|nr:ABC transporter permease [Terriglobales bacterium]
NWLGRLLRRNALEQQLDKELRFHLDERIAELTERGASPDAARRQAAIELGGRESVKEECRDARGTRWLEDFFRDVRYALRSYRHQPGFAAVVLITLALGTGATTVMFTVVNGVLLKPLPYAEPGRLLRVQERTDKATQYGNLWAVTNPNYRDLKRDVRTLDLLAIRFNGGTVTYGSESEYVDGYEISSDALAILGRNVIRGRAFAAEDDHPGAAPVAVISYSLWQRMFSASEAALGRQITFGGKAYTVIGVAPPGLQFEGQSGLLGNGADVLLCLGQDDSPAMQSRGRHMLEVWAHLRPGVTLATARAELDAIGHRLAQQYPETNRGRTFVAAPLQPDVAGVRSTLWLLLGAVALVLLIACVNVASLLLARAVSRDRELAVRVALGARRARVIRQCLTESSLLALGGGLLGVVIALAGLKPFLALWPGGLPRMTEINIDWRVLLFALGISLACGLLFGLAPAVRIPADHVEQTLRSAGRAVMSGSRRLHSGFVISEIALAIVLLVSAGVLGRTLLRLSSLDPGVNTHNVLVARMAISPAALRNPASTRAAWDRILDDLRSLPGVQAAAAVDTVPMREGNNQIAYWTTPAPPPADQLPLVLANCVTPDYLQVMGIALRRGRFLSEQDRSNTARVAVIDEVMAQKAFPGQDPMGKSIWIDLSKDPMTVVGVVAHVRQFGLAGDDLAPVRAQLYYPFAQVPDPLVRRWSELMSIAVRSNADPAALLPAMRQAVRGGAGDQVIYLVRTMNELASSTIAPERFLLMLFAVFAALALLLAAIGIYGVLAYLTNQRVPELAVRIALGCSATGVTRLVIKQSLQMVAAGVVAGGAAAWAANRVLLRVVQGAQPGGPLTFALMTSILVVAALLASLIPALRAGRVDPLSALRGD